MSWKQGFRLAFAKEFHHEDGSTYSYEKGKLEVLGSFILKPLQGFLDWVSTRIQKPFVIILMTFMALLIGVLAFYELTTIWFLARFISLAWIRFLFFVYFEMTIFAIGCRAFGRFSNANLLSEWSSGKLIPAFPGDKKFN